MLRITILKKNHTKTPKWKDVGFYLSINVIPFIWKKKQIPLGILRDLCLNKYLTNGIGSEFSLNSMGDW